MDSSESYTEEFPDADPRILWALLSDTNRSSRAMGLASGAFREERDPGGRPYQLAEGRQLGMDIAWVSGPDSWIEGSWYHAVRRYLKGPARDSVIDFRIEALGASGCRVSVKREMNGNVAAVSFDRVVAGPGLRKYLRKSAAVAAKSKGVAWGQFGPATAALGDLLEGEKLEALEGHDAAHQ